MNHSTLTRLADDILLLHAGIEVSVCCTKAFTCQLVLLDLIMLYLDQFKNPKNKLQRDLILKNLLNTPQLIHRVLENETEIAKLAKKYSKYSHFFFIGRQQMYYTAMEAALKLKEINYINAECYPAGEMKHGPIALVDSELPTIAFCGHQATLSKLKSNIEVALSRNGKVLCFAPKGNTEITDISTDVIYLPRELSDTSAPIPYSVAAQLFAYHMALSLGREIDQPRNLAKSVTVE